MAHELMALAEKVEQQGGLWKSAEVLDAALMEIQQRARGQGKGKQMDALKSQIAYRKKVLHQPILDPKDWTYSDNGRQCTVSDISTKLKIIISQTPPPLVNLEQTNATVRQIMLTNNITN
jgi:hypothetical protein